MLRYDLHCHSTCSDGVLTPAAVVARAAAQGVDVLALTDHDGTDGLAEARQAAALTDIKLIDGAELSVSWEGLTIHVVALGSIPTIRRFPKGSKRSAAVAKHAPGAWPTPWPKQASAARTKAR
jgi:predicted metal-dependent phosphoesterase TrpH